MSCTVAGSFAERFAERCYQQTGYFHIPSEWGGGGEGAGWRADRRSLSYTGSAVEGAPFLYEYCQRTDRLNSFITTLATFFGEKIDLE